MKPERKQTAREGFTFGAQFLVNTASTFRRQEAACAIAPLTDAKQWREVGDRLENVDRCAAEVGVAFAKPSFGAGLPIRFGLAHRHRYGGPTTAPSARRAREALLGSEEQHVSGRSSAGTRSRRAKSVTQASR